MTQYVTRFRVCSFQNVWYYIILWTFGYLIHIHTLLHIIQCVRQIWWLYTYTAMTLFHSAHSRFEVDHRFKTFLHVNRATLIIAPEHTVYSIFSLQPSTHPYAGAYQDFRLDFMKKKCSIKKNESGTSNSVTCYEQFGAANTRVVFVYVFQECWDVVGAETHRSEWMSENVKTWYVFSTPFPHEKNKNNKTSGRKTTQNMNNNNKTFEMSFLEWTIILVGLVCLFHIHLGFWSEARTTAVFVKYMY